MEFGCIFLTRTAAEIQYLYIDSCKNYISARNVRNMPNNQCCRGCGATMPPMSECPVCKENTSWVCNRCDTTADVTHTHSREIPAFHSRVLEELVQRHE